MIDIYNPIYAKFYTEEQMKKYIENKEKIEKAKLRKMKEEEETLDKIPMEVFCMCNVKELKKVLTDLTITEKGLVLSIAPYISFKDCCIEYTNGRYMNTKQMADISGISEKTAQEIIKSLINKNILNKRKEGRKVRYYANPWLFCRRGKVDKSLRSLFGNYRIRTKGDIKWENLKE